MRRDSTLVGMAKVFHVYSLVATRSLTSDEAVRYHMRQPQTTNVDEQVCTRRSEEPGSWLGTIVCVRPVVRLWLVVSYPYLHYNTYPLKRIVTVGL